MKLSRNAVTMSGSKQNFNRGKEKGFYGKEENKLT